MDDDATQPSTQAVDHHEQPIVIDPTVLMVLHPASPAAQVATRYLAERYPHFVLHNTSQQPDICLRYTVPPKNAELGYTFGRNPIKCDVPLGQQCVSRRVSNLHFRIFLNQVGVVMIEDLSTNGTWVDNTCIGAPRGHETAGATPPARRRILTNSSLILLALGPVEDELKFVVNMRNVNVPGWRKVCTVGRLLAMGPPGFLNPNGQVPIPAEQDTLDAQDELDAMPPGWGGEDGIYEIFPGFIGKGAFAIVKKAVHKSTGEQFAIKIINKRAFAGTEESPAGRKKGDIRRLGVMKEVEIMKQLIHENIVRFYEWQETRKQLHIRMEFLEHGDLGEYLRKHGPLVEPTMQEISRQVINALRYVHSLRISHRDIKPENILLKSLNPIVIKLSDFGLAKMIQNEETFLKTFCGTMLYLAPEVFPMAGANKANHTVKARKQHQRYNQACDMWSYGCVIYFALTGAVPFHGSNQDEIKKAILRGVFDTEKLRQHGISEAAIHFLTHMLKVDPEKRLLEEDALRHAWLSRGQAGQYGQGPYVSRLDTVIPEEDDLDGLDVDRILDAINEWEEMKDEVDIENSQAVQKNPELVDDEISRSQIQDGQDLQVQIIEDAEGDFEMEGSQQQQQRLERERFELVAQQTQRPIANIKEPQIRNPEESLLSPSPSARGTPVESNDDDEADDFYNGLSGFADQAGQGASPGLEFSDQGSSGVLGGDYEEVHGDFHDMQHSRFGGESINSSHGNPFQFESVLGSNQPSIMPATGRGVLASRRTPGADGKSLAGVRTMVGELQVDGSSDQHSVLHKKGSGLLSMDDRVGKKKSTTSLSFNVGAVASKLAQEACIKTMTANLHQVRGPGETTRTTRTTQPPAQQFIQNDRSSSSISPPVNGQTANAMRQPSAPTVALQPKANFIEPRQIWGRLVPVAGSLPHQTINLVEQLVSYGRSSICVCTVNDTRVSKQHFAIKLLDDNTQPSVLEDSPQRWEPQNYMTAWCKINGSNGVFVNQTKHSKNETIRVFDGDVLVVFKDKSEFLGFKLELIIGRRERSADDIRWYEDFMLNRPERARRQHEADAEALHRQQAGLGERNQAMSGA